MWSELLFAARAAWSEYKVNRLRASLESLRVAASKAEDRMRELRPKLEALEAFNERWRRPKDPP